MSHGCIYVFMLAVSLCVPIFEYVCGSLHIYVSPCVCIIVFLHVCVSACFLSVSESVLACLRSRVGVCERVVLASLCVFVRAPWQLLLTSPCNAIIF